LSLRGLSPQSIDPQAPNIADSQQQIAWRQLHSGSRAQGPG
jgi:hypothetical protein